MAHRKIFNIFVRHVPRAMNYELIIEVKYVSKKYSKNR